MFSEDVPERTQDNTVILTEDVHSITCYSTPDGQCVHTVTGWMALQAASRLHGETESYGFLLGTKLWETELHDTSQECPCPNPTGTNQVRRTVEAAKDQETKDLSNSYISQNPNKAWGVGYFLSDSWRGWETQSVISHPTTIVSRSGEKLTLCPALVEWSWLQTGGWKKKGRGGETWPMLKESNKS